MACRCAYEKNNILILFLNCECINIDGDARAHAPMPTTVVVEPPKNICGLQVGGCIDARRVNWGLKIESYVCK